MGRPRLIDLTMEIYQGMPTYPSVAKPFVHELENHEQMARSTGAWQYGLTHAPESLCDRQRRPYWYPP